MYFGDYEDIWYQDNNIEIPYGFIAHIRDHYESVNFPHKNTSLDQFTGNALLHIIVHEFAHALIDQYDIPVLGREEEAADNLADVLLLHFFTGGEDIVASAADLFYINTIGVKEYSKEELWADHSLDIQRYYRRLCNIYGSNPDNNKALKTQTGFDEERAGRCVFQYSEMLDSWLSLLEPALKH